MPAPIDFYFDFSSPYGYLAAEQVDALAARHARGVAWRPILLGVVFLQAGGPPLLKIPLQGGYARPDPIGRTAGRERACQYGQIPGVSGSFKKTGHADRTNN